jgi:uncharacterized membrane protein
MKSISFKRYFLAGILILVPIWVTYSILDFLVRKFDNIMALLPIQYQPDTLLGFHVPGFGLIVIVLLILFTGVLTTNFIGTYVITLGESLVARIPLVRSIYAGVKKILNTMLSSDGQSFRKVVLIEYPRKGVWTLAFQTGSGFKEAEKDIGEELISVFVPTTPNPTGGFLLLMPRKDVIELKISVDEAFKMIISLGVILPKEIIADNTDQLNNKANLSKLKQ